MRAHYMLHHQWGNFRCDRCDYLAFYSTDFAYHVLTVHSKSTSGGGCEDADDAEKVQGDWWFAKYTQSGPVLLLYWP